MATTEKTLEIQGMTCSACANRIEKTLSKMDGVEQANVNFALERSTISYDPDKVGVHDFEEKIEKLGYNVVHEQVKFDVSGMTCAACATKIVKRNNKKEDVSKHTI